MMANGTDAAHLPLALLVVFGSAKLLAEACERIGQPGIVGEILAGVLIGPSVFGWVYPDQTLSALAELGVMFLLFRVGLEVKASELMNVGGTAFIVATLGVAVPMGLGVLVMLWAGVSTIEALFVGASLVATSVGITAQVLAAKGLLQQRASKVILAAAVIDDVLGLLVLAFVSSLA
ncbi:MAG TPA: cation:proton antiporter, partial [Bryobacteraceae bacterium]